MNSKELISLKEKLNKVQDEYDSYKKVSEEQKKKLDESKAIIEDNNHGMDIF